MENEVDQIDENLVKDIFKFEASSKANALMTIE